LAFIASLPIILPLFLGLPSSIAFGGTGMIILIGVSLELAKEIDGRMASKDYKGLFR
jgi:preprotein translocase subunit SecY